jgi:hypothetical protein
MQVPRGSMQWPLLGALLVSSAAPAVAQERPALADATEQILAAVDVVLTHRVVEADGRPAMPIATESAFRLQKLRTRSGATKIRLTYRRAKAGDASPAFSNPLDGARVEYDPALQSTIVFDEAGRRPNPRLSSASTSSTALGSVESWLEELVFRTSDAGARREALEHSHGRPVGRIGRLSRYLQNRGEVSEELLADLATGLPVEVNLVRQNTLEGHITIDYDTVPDGGLVRRRLQSEQVIDPRSGRRSILAVEFSNVAVEGR